MAKQKTEEQVDTEPFNPRYPALEKLVDSEDFDEINAHYAQAYDELEKLAKQKGMGKARDAKKAMKAFERVMDLLKYLLKLKYQYLEAQAGSQHSGESSPRKKKSGETQLQGKRTR